LGLYNFQPRFVPLILSGKKTHTIRAVRKNTACVGETLHLYTGLRQPGARLLMRVPCVGVEEITITRNDSEFWITIDGNLLDKSECEALARCDGFENFERMMVFWVLPKNRLPFKGHIIHWRKK
jgi:hypothetical protein